MPKYGTLPPLNARGNSPAVVWNNETVTPGTGAAAASQQVQLLQNPETNTTAFGVQIQFSGDPGASLGFLVQVSDRDVDTAYATVANGSLTNSILDTTNFTGRFDANSVISAKFARCKLTVFANTATVTVYASISQ